MRSENPCRLNFKDSCTLGCKEEGMSEQELGVLLKTLQRTRLIVCVKGGGGIKLKEAGYLISQIFWSMALRT